MAYGEKLDLHIFGAVGDGAECLASERGAGERGEFSRRPAGNNHKAMGKGGDLGVAVDAGRQRTFGIGNAGV